MTETPSWAGNVPTYSGVRGPLPAPQWDEVSQNTLDDLRLRLRESVTESILMAIQGFFIPGPLGTAFTALSDWASDLLNIQNLLDAFNGVYEGDNLALIAIEGLFTPIRGLVSALGDPLIEWLTWLWNLFSGVTPNPAPTGLGADLLVPIFTFIHDAWNNFTTATGNFMEDVFSFLNWLWRRFANIPGDNTPPTGPGFDLLVPIFSFLDDVWDDFTTATGNLLGNLFQFLNWLWRRFANIPGDNTPPTGPGFDLLVPIFSFLDDTWDAFTTATGNVLGNLFQFLNWLWRRFANLPGATPPTGPGFDLLVPIFSFLDDIWDAFGEGLQQVFTFVMNVFSPMAAIFNGDIVGNVIKQVVEFFNGIITTFGSITAGLPSFASVGEAIADAIQTVGEWVFGLINGLTGGLFGTILEGLEGIAAWAADLPLIGPIISALVPPDWRNSVGLPASALSDLKEATAESLTTSSVLYADNLYGQIPADLLPPTGSGDVANYKPNLIADPSFKSAAAVQAGEGWSWDSTTSRTAGDGGSAKVTGNGGVRQMFSNRVAVSPGQELEVSVYTKWTKPSAARPTISVGLRAYNGEAVLFTQAVSSQSNVVSDSGWVQLKGNYAIPANMAITHVRLSMSVLNAPSGTSVWFDEAALRRVSLISPSLVEGVGTTSSTLADDIENAVGSDQFDSLLRAISKKTGYSLADVEATIADFLDGDSEISGDQIKAGDIASEFISELGSTWDQIWTGSQGSAPPKAKDLTSAFDALVNWRTVISSAGGLSSGAQSTADGAVKRVEALEKNNTDLRTYLGLMAADVRKVCVALSIAPTTPATLPGEAPVNFTAVNDNFDRATIGNAWSVNYRSTAASSLIIPDGTNAFFQVPEFYNLNNTFAATYSVGSSTDYQRVYCTLGSAPGRPGVGSMGYNDLLGRVASWNRCIVARFYNDAARTVRLFWRAGSWETDPYAPATANQFGVFNMPSDLTSGSVLEFYVGSKSLSDQTKCFVKVGTWSSAVATMNASALSTMGKGWGFGGGNGLSFPAPLSASQYAGKVNFWGAQDQ